jgi:AcrR family transcriptional regulator
MNRDNGGQEHAFHEHRHGEHHGGVRAAHGAPGLRERKKLATRQALSDAAIQLALERGFDNLRVEDIAEAAGVSPRTFNNYFSSREEAICAARTAQIERIARELVARPAEESLLEAIGNAMTADSSRHREPVRDLVRLFVANPAVHAEFLRTAGQTTSPMIEAVAERTGTLPDDLLPQVVTSAALGAMRAAMHKWLSDEQSLPYPSLVREALNQLRVLAATPEAAAPVNAPPSTTGPGSTRPSVTVSSTTALTDSTLTNSAPSDSGLTGSAPSDSAPDDPAADNAVGTPAPGSGAAAPGGVSAVSAASVRQAIISGRAA